MGGRTGATVSTEVQPSGAALRWVAWPLRGVAWAHAQARTALRRVGLVVGGLGTLLREAAAGVLFVALWMVTFGLMWGMVAVLLGALIEQVAEMLPPGDGIQVEPRLAVWLWAGFLCAYPVRWFVLRILAMRRPAARAAMGQMLSGPLRVWRGRWRVAGADRTIDGAAASGINAALVAQMRRDEVTLDDERRIWLSGRRRSGGRHEPARRSPTATPPPVPRARSAGWAFGPPIELPEGPLFTIEPFLGYRRWVVRPSSVVGGAWGNRSWAVRSWTISGSNLRWPPGVGREGGAGLTRSPRTRTPPHLSTVAVASMRCGTRQEWTGRSMPLCA